MHALVPLLASAALHAAAPLALGAAQDPFAMPGEEGFAPALTQSGDELVRMTLVADRAAIRPGESFALGVHLSIERGWHVYWTNPGDSGQAVEAELRAPDGLTLSPVVYPGPKRFEEPGGIVNYGYAGETLLWFEARAAKSLVPGAQLVVEADAEWLVCDEVCLPGGGSDTLTLTVEGGLPRTAAAARGKETELFDRFRPRLPRAWGELQGTRVRWSGTDEAPVLALHLPRLDKSNAALELSFFPDATPVGLRLDRVRVEPARAAANEHSLELTYRVRKPSALAGFHASGLVCIRSPRDKTERFYRLDHAWDEGSRANRSGSH